VPAAVCGVLVPLLSRIGRGFVALCRACLPDTKKSWSGKGSKPQGKKYGRQDEKHFSRKIFVIGQHIDMLFIIRFFRSISRFFPANFPLFFHFANQ
jgi:hypothetical protein